MSYTHLTEEERYHIDEMLRQGYKQNKIAQELGRNVSTLSRELNRNAGKNGWRPKQANEQARNRLTERGKGNVKKVDKEAWELAVQKLKTEQWSPEQISGWQKRNKISKISHESIYQRIRNDKSRGGDLHKYLRCQKKRRKKYGTTDAGHGCIPDRVDIDERPKVVDTRKRIGDWEGDTVIGTHKKGSVLATMVERKTRFLVATKAKDKTTHSVIGSINEKMKKFSQLTETVTFDNGKEFSGHKNLSNKLKCNVFFAKPYHSWERGTNENTNGLLRQYYPKGTDFNGISDKEIQKIVNKINNRPRKCLNYKTPAEVFSELANKKGIALRI